jgi:hypothetical protein
MKVPQHVIGGVTQTPQVHEILVFPFLRAGVQGVWLAATLRLPVLAEGTFAEVCGIARRPLVDHGDGEPPVRVRKVAVVALEVGVRDVGAVRHNLEVA